MLPTYARRLQAESGLTYKPMLWLAGILLKVGSAQTLVQAVQLGAGLWIIRAATRSEYAYYTIANTLLFAILLLTDSGVTSSLSSEGGKAWQDKRRLGELLRTGLHLRRHFMVIVTGLLIPVMIALLMRNGASTLHAATIAVVVTATVVAELTVHMYLMIFRLRRQYDFTQRLALFGAAGRLLWLGLWSGGHLSAELALLASSASSAIQWVWLRRRIEEHVDLHTVRDPLVEREMRSVISRQIPLNIYFCLQGQVAIWLASTFGSAHEVSDIGALGRLAAVFTVSQAIMQEVVFPAFARAQSPQLLSKRYIQITAAYIGFLSLVVLAIIALRNPAMGLLGQQYSWLGPQLPVAMLYSAMWALTQVLWGLNYSRAWIQPPIPYIAVTTVLQLVLFRMLRAYTVNEILWFTVASLIPAMIFPVFLSIRRIRGLEQDVPLPAVELNHA